jgi:hypothetical protein
MKGKNWTKNESSENKKQMHICSVHKEVYKKNCGQSEHTVFRCKVLLIFFDSYNILLLFSSVKKDCCNLARSNKIALYSTKLDLLFFVLTWEVYGMTLSLQNSKLCLK